MSDIDEVRRKAKKYLNKDVEILISNRKYKKFMVLDPNTNKYVHFGDNRYEDYTKHKDEKRRDAFLKRSIPRTSYVYNPLNLSRNILW